MRETSLFASSNSARAFVLSVAFLAGFSAAPLRAQTSRNSMQTVLKFHPRSKKPPSPFRNPSALTDRGMSCRAPFRRRMPPRCARRSRPSGRVISSPRSDIAKQRTTRFCWVTCWPHATSTGIPSQCAAAQALAGDLRRLCGCGGHSWTPD